MFVLLLMFFQVSQSQVPITHYTQHLTLLIHTCQHGWLRKVRRVLSHLLKARCLHRTCRKNQTVIFVLLRYVLLPIRGRVQGRSSVMMKRRGMETVIPEEIPNMTPRRNNARMPDIPKRPARKEVFLFLVPPIRLIIFASVRLITTRSVPRQIKVWARLVTANTKNAATLALNMNIQPFPRGMSAPVNVIPVTERNIKSCVIRKSIPFLPMSAARRAAAATVVRMTTAPIIKSAHVP